MNTSEYRFREIPPIVFCLFALMGFAVFNLILGNTSLEIKIMAFLIAIAYVLLTAIFETYMIEQDVERWRLEA